MNLLHHYFTLGISSPKIIFYWKSVNALKGKYWFTLRKLFAIVFLIKTIQMFTLIFPANCTLISYYSFCNIQIFPLLCCTLNPIISSVIYRSCWLYPTIFYFSYPSPSSSISCTPSFRSYLLCRSPTSSISCASLLPLLSLIPLSYLFYLLNPIPPLLSCAPLLPILSIVPLSYLFYLLCPSPTSSIFRCLATRKEFQTLKSKAI